MEEKNDIMSRIAQAKTKEELSGLYVELVGKYKEAIAASPKLASALVKQGYKDAVEAINKKVEEVQQGLQGIDQNDKAAREDLEGGVYAREAKNQAWQDTYSKRSKTVKEAVHSVHASTIERKAMLAAGTITLTTLGAKTARLFGAKGLAKEMQEKGNNYANALMTKDSRIDQLAEHMAESGFAAADTVRDTIEEGIKKLGELKTKGSEWVNRRIEDLKATKTRVEKAIREGAKTVQDKAEDVILDVGSAIETGVHAVADGIDTAIVGTYVVLDDGAKAVIKGAKTVGGAVLTAAKGTKNFVVTNAQKAGKTVREGVKSGVNFVKEGIESTRNDIRDIGTQGTEARTQTDNLAQERDENAAQWRNDHKKRSGIILDAVEGAEWDATDRRKMVSMGLITLSTLGAKTARLFGAKNLAKNMQANTKNRVEKIMKSESRIGKFARETAQDGFDFADDVRAGVKQVKEDATELAKQGVTLAKETGKQAWTATKKGAIAVGKVAMVPVAGVHALGSLAVDAGAKVVETVGNKVNDVKEDIEQYTEIASAKVETVRHGMNKGFNGRAKEFVDGIIGKLVEASKRFESKEEKASQAQEQSQIRLAAAKAKKDPQKEAQENDGFDK